MVDEQIIELFEEFKTLKGKYTDFDIKVLLFNQIDLFNNKDIILRGSITLENHEKLEKINDKNGIPVFDASPNILTYIDETKYRHCIFSNVNKNNPDLSFANEGNSSAGTNFIFHTNKYFVNNHRTVIDFSKSDFYSKYIYYCIKEMKEEYGFKRGYTPSQTRLRQLNINIPIPKQINKTYTSYKIQEILVEFIEYYSNRNNKGIKIINEEIFPRIEKIEKLVLPQFFDKEKTMCNIFNAYAKKNNYDVKLEDVEFEIKNTVDIGEFKGGSPLFTKKYINNNKGKYPVYSASTDIKTKGVSGYINTYQFDTAAIHITKNGEKTGTVFYFDKHKHSINGDRAIFLINEKLYNSKFIYLCLKSLELDKIHDWGNKLTKTKFEDYKIIIPKPTKNYTSYELQKIFADFIENYFKKVEKSKNISNYLINKYKEFTETVISRTLKA